MATATRISDGNYMDYTPGVAIAAGTVVLFNGNTSGSLFGIPERDIAANVQGSLAIKGVFKLPKLSTDVVLEGEMLYWDVGNQRCTVTKSTHKSIGRAVKSAANGVTTVIVSINDLYA